jgi:hypothetical protein
VEAENARTDAAGHTTAVNYFITAKTGKSAKSAGI